MLEVRDQRRRVAHQIQLLHRHQQRVFHQCRQLVG
jgi:hypothetical protein